jgi:MFS family permease
LGLGLGYIVPVATLVKWFPDRRGFITGLAVAGFGAGALLTAPVASALIERVGVLQTLGTLGIIYLAMVVAGASVMSNPPPGWVPRVSPENALFPCNTRCKIPHYKNLGLKTLFVNVIKYFRCKEGKIGPARETPLALSIDSNLFCDVS